jgi:hypothetical protein
MMVRCCVYIFASAILVIDFQIGKFF